MNRKLNNEWTQKQGLFSNAMLCCEMEYTKTIQLEILEVIWEYLNANSQLNETLFFLNDWHQHDGHISIETEIDKKELKNILTNPKEVFKHRDIDVYDLVHNEALTFMVRWYCEVENKKEGFCDFSLILPNDKELNKVKELIQQKVPIKGLKIINAKEYFDNRYAG